MRAVNLIPSESRSGVGSGPARSGGGAYAVLGLLAGLALLALLYGSAHHQLSSRRAKLATLTAQTERATASASRLTPYTSFIALREQRMQAVSQLVDSRFDWAHAFHELGRVLPQDVSITSLEGTIGASAKAPSTAGSPSAASSTPASAPAGSSVTPPGSVPSFTLSGCATSQSGVAIALDRLRLIDGAQEVNLQSSTKGTGAGSTGTASGGCPAGDPAFTVQVAFAPLPDQATTKASTTELTAAKGAGQ